jgi:Glycosyl transferase family 2
MKLVMTLLVRDEADIVAANIDFHLANGVDFIIAMDNLSLDGTTDILREYERQGVLHYINQPNDNYAQGEWATSMARAAASEFAADWIINNDADEFWWPEEGSLKSTLAAVDASWQAVAIERTNFIPCPVSESNFFADCMTIRERCSLNALGDPLPGKVCHRALPDIEVTAGNHSVYRRGRALPAMKAQMAILHFPMRSYRQFADKIVKGGAALARNENLPPSIGATWRRLREIWQRGELETYYQALMRNEETIIASLKDGSLIFDDRLKRWLSQHKPAQTANTAA